MTTTPPKLIPEDAIVLKALYYKVRQERNAVLKGVLSEDLYSEISKILSPEQVIRTLILLNERGYVRKTTAEENTFYITEKGIQLVIQLEGLK